MYRATAWHNLFIDSLILIVKFIDIAQFSLCLAFGVWWLPSALLSYMVMFHWLETFLHGLFASSLVTMIRFSSAVKSIDCEKNWNPNQCIEWSSRLVEFFTGSPSYTVCLSKVFDDFCHFLYEKISCLNRISFQIITQDHYSTHFWFGRVYRTAANHWAFS